MHLDFFKLIKPLIVCLIIRIPYCRSVQREEYLGLSTEVLLCQKLGFSGPLHSVRNIIVLSVCFLSLLCWKMTLCSTLVHTKGISSRSQGLLCIWLHSSFSQLWLISLSLQLESPPKINAATPMLDGSSGVDQVICRAWYFSALSKLLYIIYSVMVMEYC